MDKLSFSDQLKLVWSTLPKHIRSTIVGILRKYLVDYPDSIKKYHCFGEYQPDFEKFDQFVSKITYQSYKNLITEVKQIGNSLSVINEFILVISHKREVPRFSETPGPSCTALTQMDENYPFHQLSWFDLRVLLITHFEKYAKSPNLTNPRQTRRPKAKHLLKYLDSFL